MIFPNAAVSLHATADFVANEGTDSGSLIVTMVLSVHDLCFFEPVLRLSLRDTVTGAMLTDTDSHQGGLYWHWLPTGEYSLTVRLVGVSDDYAADRLEVLVSWGTPTCMRPADAVLPVLGKLAVLDEAASATPAPTPWIWQVSAETQTRICALPWSSGMSNWFFRHFDHAARVITDEFLKKDARLSGHILDVGAGDGITDLGIFLRYQPKSLVAIDIVNHMTHLPEVAREHGIPLQAMPEHFKFVNGSAEDMPFDDASFDVVISWGSVEHIKGGYAKAMDEIWRVLKPDGLLFINPGLYYAPAGSHLGEFFPEPHHHIKLTDDELVKQLFERPVARMDRAGFDVGPDEYLRFYRELNVITVASFEAEFRRFGYKIIRGAMRSVNMVEYDDRMQAHSLIDLSTEDAFYVLQKPVI